jgi:hypothetical protein
VTGMKFPPFDLVVLMTTVATREVLSEMLACGLFGLKRQAGLRLGGPCGRIRRFRLLCVHLIFMPWLGLTLAP